MDYPNEGFVVTEDILNAHSRLSYPLFEGDLLTHNKDGSWMKEAPGVCVDGFKLTIDQEASLRRVNFARDGLQYAVDPRS